MFNPHIFKCIGCGSSCRRPLGLSQPDASCEHPDIRARAENLTSAVSAFLTGQKRQKSIKITHIGEATLLSLPERTAFVKRQECRFPEMDANPHTA